MNEIREILTKAVIGKGSKLFEMTTLMPKTSGVINSILGTNVINHETTAKRIGDRIDISGSYDIHIWYAFNDNQETEIVRETVKYHDVITLQNALREKLLEGDDIIAEEVLPPYATDVRIVEGVIHVDIMFEVIAEVIGEMKMRVAILGPVVESITPEISFDPDDDLAEIDALIKPDFLDATILPFN